MKWYLMRFVGLLLFVLLFLTVIETAAFAQFGRRAGVSAEALPSELKELVVQDIFIPSSHRAVGVIHGLTGHVVIIHRATKEAYFGQAGDTIYENDALHTLADSRCRIRFQGEDIVSMGAETEFGVERLEDHRSQRKHSFFSILKGKAMFYAMRLLQYRETRFQVKTPTAVVGVRGTKFGMHVYWLEQGETATSGIGTAGDGRSFTECFCEDGFLDVDGMLVSPGETYREALGAVIATPPEMLKEFSEKVGVRPEREVTGTGEEKLFETITSKEAATLDQYAETRDAADGHADEASRERGEQVFASVLATQDIPVQACAHCGYFSGMLTDNAPIPPPATWVRDVFVSAMRQNFSLNTAKAIGLLDPSTYFLEITGTAENQDAYLKRAVFQNRFGSTYDSGDLAQEHPINDVVIGRNSYQEWGYWTRSHPFGPGIPGASAYQVDNKGYYIEGYATPDSAMHGFRGDANYGGSAWGTYWTSAGGVDMSGSFDCEVDFDLGTVKHLNMMVSNGGYSASIVGASGTFAGSQFGVEAASGTWTLDDGSGPYTPGKRLCAGSLYGPKAEHLGGAWGMYYSNVHGAAGVFQGNRN